MGGCYVLSLLVGLCDFLLGGVEIGEGEGVDEMDEGMKIKSWRMFYYFSFVWATSRTNTLWDGWDGAMDGGKGSSIIGGYGLFICFMFFCFFRSYRLLFLLLGVV